jgi:hypothetical protein
MRGVAAEPSSPPRVLTKAGEIAADVTPLDAEPARVVFEGPVAYQDPMRTIFLADDTGVTFIFGFKAVNPLVQAGDRIRVTGVAHQGVIIGGIRPDRIEVIGRGDPPPAVPVAPQDLTTGRYHYHRVAIEGVVRSVAAAGDSAIVLTLQTAGNAARIEVEAPAAEAEAAAERLVDARVRATGLVVGNINDRRQVVEPFIRVKQLADVEVLDPPPADAFAIPPTPLDALASRTIGVACGCRARPWRGRWPGPCISATATGACGCGWPRRQWRSYGPATSSRPLVFPTWAPTASSLAMR